MSSVVLAVIFLTAVSVCCAMAGEPSLREWADSAILQPKEATGPEGLELRRQDHGLFGIRQSTIGTPLQIGSKKYEHGLGTHSTSEILVRLPEPAQRFTAEVGVDNNADTNGQHGSVTFSIETVSGKELWHSKLCRGGEAPIPIAVDLAGVRAFTLRVSDGGDGPAHDHADWGQAAITTQSGKTLFLDALPHIQPPAFLETGLPFSFVYNGKSSAEFLGAWKREAKSEPDQNGIEKHTIVYTDPATGLQVTCRIRFFVEPAAMDWVLYFKNTGTSDTPILENIQALDTRWALLDAQEPVRLHQIRGDDCTERTFLPFESVIERGTSVALAPVGGRPSNGTFPFFTLSHGGTNLVIALGWTGQWAAGIDCGPHFACIHAGMEKTHLLLHPGEEIRTPRIALLAQTGDPQETRNAFRQLLLKHYVPQRDGKPVQLWLASNCFDRYYPRDPKEWKSEGPQIQAAEYDAKIGVDTYWLDAAWFPGGFPHGVGNWRFTDVFPRGLKPVSDRCHELGLRVALWFEPERVAHGTQIWNEHPTFVHQLSNSGPGSSGLYRLDHPEALKHMTDLLSALIRDNGIDIYRSDFNIDPLPFWRAADAPDRQGMTEIRYVEGLYAMWDELVARKPGLLIDDCASGGRRIDLEALARATVMTRSDTACLGGRSEWDQAQSYGLSLYFPTHTTMVWSPDAYICRSGSTNGSVTQFDYLDPNFDMALAKKAVQEIRTNAPYWYGDFYPLTSCSIQPNAWLAFQLHRADLKGGLVVAFRRKECRHEALQVKLERLEPSTTYVLETVDEAYATTRREASGRELMKGLKLKCTAPGTSVVVRYKQAD